MVELSLGASISWWMIKLTLRVSRVFLLVSVMVVEPI